MTRTIAATAAALLLSVGGLALPQAIGAASPDPSTTPPPNGVIGARTLDDPFYPTLGNGGYDVNAYDLDLTWHAPDATRPDGWISGVATIDIEVQVPLSELSFDLSRRNTDVASVLVNGTPAGSRADGLGRKLIVTPAKAVPGHSKADVRVVWDATPMGVHRLGEELPMTEPGRPPGEVARAVARGFLGDGVGGFFMASQPDGAHTLFPSNDHPSDKALVTVHLTAPAGMLGVATGTRIGQTANVDGTTTTTWRSDQPVATHVLAMGVERSTVIEDDTSTGPHLRSSVPIDLAVLAPARLGAMDEARTWLEGAIGRPFPFRSLGLQVVPLAASDAILEGQTLILVGAGILDPRVTDCDWRGLVVHETAHQWFGDSVSLMRWDQKWLSEGHATYYERAWEAANGCDPLGSEERMHRVYAAAQAVRDAGGPPDRPRSPRWTYTSVIYDQGALALYALHEQVGDAAFRRIETTFLDRFSGRSASTDDFIAVAAKVAGPSIVPFLEDWLRSDQVPPMPGHPTWRSESLRPPPTGSDVPAPTESTATQ